MCNADWHGPNCPCGWGPVKREANTTYGYQKYSASALRSLNDFTAPTRCYYCNDPVYFVRHNGGSVWFDDLGKPWQKHHCYYDPIRLPHSEKKIIGGIDKWLKTLVNPMMGIVYDTENDIATKTKYVFVHSINGDYQKVRVHVPFLLDGFKGEFVIYSVESNKIVRPYLSIENEYPLVLPLPPSPRVAPVYEPRYQPEGRAAKNPFTTRTTESIAPNPHTNKSGKNIFARRLSRGGLPPRR